MTPDNLELVGLVFSVSLKIFLRVQKLKIITFNSWSLQCVCVCLQVCVNTYIYMYIKLRIYFSPRPRRCLVILYAQVKTVQGFETLILLRQPSAHPISSRNQDWLTLSGGNPKIKTDRVTSHICSSCPYCWSSPTAGLLPASPSDASFVWAQLIWIAKECWARQAVSHSSAKA